MDGASSIHVGPLPQSQPRAAGGGLHTLPTHHLIVIPMDFVQLLNLPNLEEGKKKIPHTKLFHLKTFLFGYLPGSLAGWACPLWGQWDIWGEDDGPALRGCH